MGRIAFLDNLKSLAIILVVFVHASVTYSGIGEWFYCERRDLSAASYYFFLFFETFSQAFFMSLLFAIAGYFIPQSLAKKGAVRFIASRAFRLLLPALFFALVISPICRKEAFSDWTLHDYVEGITTFKFLSWTGPLWFTVALFLFTLIYLVFKRLCDWSAQRFTFEVTARNVIALIFLISVCAFAIRLVFPIGTSVMNLQFSFFSAYIFLFFLGIFSQIKGIFDRIDFQLGKKWLFTAFAVGIPWWIVTIYFGVPVDGNERHLNLLVGGWNWAALSFAFWEGFVCVAIILGLIGVFKHLFNRQNDFQRFLSENSFGVYVFHAPILIGVTLLFAQVSWPPIAKWASVAVITLLLTFVFAWAVRKIPVFHKIFS